jgi:hypothetical protein
MKNPGPIPERIAVAAHPKVSEARSTVKEIAEFLQHYGLSTAQGLLYDQDLRRQVKNTERTTTSAGW